jgi:hypothetical protein
VRGKREGKREGEREQSEYKREQQLEKEGKMSLLAAAVATDRFAYLSMIISRASSSPTIDMSVKAFFLLPPSSSSSSSA